MKPVLGTILGHAALHAAGTGVLPIRLRAGEQLTSRHAYDALHRLDLAGTLYSRHGKALLQCATQALAPDTTAFLLDTRVETYGVHVKHGESTFILPLVVESGTALTGFHLRKLLDKFVFAAIRHPNGRDVTDKESIPPPMIAAMTFLLDKTAVAGAAAAARPGKI